MDDVDVDSDVDSDADVVDILGSSAEIYDINYLLTENVSRRLHPSSRDRGDVIHQRFWESKLVQLRDMRDVKEGDDCA
jgi:hypothetical protein